MAVAVVADQHVAGARGTADATMSKRGKDLEVAVAEGAVGERTSRAGYHYRSLQWLIVI